MMTDKLISLHGCHCRLSLFNLGLNYSLAFVNLRNQDFRYPGLQSVAMQLRCPYSRLSLSRNSVFA